MPRYIFALVLIVSLASAAAAAPALFVQQDIVRDELAHASTLYYEANFKESIDLLLRLDEVLKPEAGRLPEKTSVKLQLALAYVAVNDSAQARSRFDELYALDADFSIDAQQYPPKVISLAKEAKDEQDKIRTLRLCDAIRKQVETESAGVSADEILSMKSRCRDLPLFASKAADLFYKRGLEAYKRNEFSAATQLFNSALKLDPDHELAAQYTDLIQQKMRVSADRLLLEWRKDFDSKNFTAATAAYRDLQSLNKDGAVEPLLNQAQVEYRKAMSPLMDSWTRACNSGDSVSMSNVRKQARDLLPETSIGEDMLAKMTCAPKAEAKLSGKPSVVVPPPAVSSKECVQMDSRLALTRLKTRIDPVVPTVSYNLLRRSPTTVRIQARIEETGTVKVLQIVGENLPLNEAVRTAVERWKFSPAIIRDETRCVETEIPMVIGLDGFGGR